MALITSSILIRSFSLLHLTIAFYLLTNPALIASHNIVLIFSRAMDLPDASLSSSSFGAPSQPAALAALFLAFLALADFAAAGLADLAYHEHWGLQAPLRIALLFTLEGWTYATGGVDVWKLGAGSGWGLLKNGMVFTWAFVELIGMFWIWTKLREERTEVYQKEAERQLEIEKLKGS